MEIRALDGITLHIGMHKCGSTAIQNACDVLRQDLLREGIYYPRGDHAVVSSFYANSRTDFFYNEAFGRTDVDEISRQDKLAMDRIWRDLRRSRCHRLVLSYEGFPNLNAGEVRAMIEDLSARSRSVTIVVYCRHPLSFAPSELSQRARLGVTTDVFASAPPILAYESSLPKFVEAVGTTNMVVRDVDRRQLLNGNVAVDFLHIVGASRDLALKAPDEAPLISRSLSQEAFLLAKALTALGDPNRPMSQFGAAFQEFLGRIDGTPIRLSDAEATFVLDASAPHLEYLRNTFGLTLLEPNQPNEPSGPKALFGEQFLNSLAAAVKPLLDAKEREDARSVER